MSLFVAHCIVFARPEEEEEEDEDEGEERQGSSTWWCARELQWESRVSPLLLETVKVHARQKDLGCSVSIVPMQAILVTPRSEMCPSGYDIDTNTTRSRSESAKVE